MRDVKVQVYGCVWCQQYHAEGEPLFEAHRHYEAKHHTYCAPVDNWAQYRKGHPALPAPEQSRESGEHNEQVQ